MAILPTSDQLTGADTTNASQKTYFTALRTFLADLLGTNSSDKAAARTALDAVGLTGNETIAGVKTFSISPVVPTPTTDTQAANKGYVDGKVGAIPVPESIPTGFITFWPASTAPAGWLKCNGATVSRADYAGLFAVIGTTYGAGDGSTTFKLPDLRGEFLRFLDDGRGIDAGRAIGSAQAGQNAAHSHGLEIWALTAGSGTANGNQIASRGPSSTTPAGWQTVASSDNYGSMRIASAGGAENRPRNVAMLPIIKY